MLRSMSSGVSGLENMQVAMDALGNNIANVNTVGYKGEKVTFHSQFNQLLQDGSGPTATRGGTNPEEVGLGVGIASIDTDQAQGALQTTGKNTDLAISGNGYFVVSDGITNYYTRDGGFDFDRNGSMVKVSNGMKVQGWMATGNPPTINTSAAIGSITIPTTTTLQPQPTANITLGGNFDANTPSVGPNNTFSQSITWHDSLGNTHTGNLTWTHTIVAGNNTWQATGFTSSDPAVNAAATLGTFANNTLTFNSSGQLTAPAAAMNANVTYNAGFGLPPTQAVAFTNTNVGSTSPMTDFAVGTATQPITTVVMSNDDGYASGNLRTVSIDQNGNIQGAFSNGQNRLLAQVAMASFTNPSGLNTMGGNIYGQATNSGSAQIGTANAGPRGGIQSGAREGSNVDLAQSFSDMITVERGFQANSKIITTSDQMLQELLTLKQ